MLRSRYNKITRFFGRMLLSYLFWELVLPRLGFKARAQQSRSQRLRRSAAQFRTLAIEMGGLLIKLGQFFSARADVLPDEITSELADLQDEVPAERFDDIRRVVEVEFGVPIEDKFLSFEETPLAAASLGQVHRAYLKIEPDLHGDHEKEIDQPPLGSGEDQAADREPGLLAVVVKIQRPDIQRIIETDLAAMRTVARWLHRYKPIRQRMHLPSLLDEFTRISLDEIDYLVEGQNAEHFSENYQGDPDVRIPHVFWTHTSRRVLTLEDVLAIKITEYEAIKEAGIAPGLVARRLIDTYLKQIFEDGFFHADPHPGNLFVLPLRRDTDNQGKHIDWQLTFVDFGMVGRVTPLQRDGFREAAIGVATQDPERLTTALQMLGFLLPNADLTLLKQAEGEVFNRYWGKDMGQLRDISHQEIRELAYEFRGLLYSLPFQIPQDLILLGRAVGILSGMCTGLDPNFNVWESITPYAKKLLKEETMLGEKVWLDILKSVLQEVISFPRRVNALVDRIEKVELAFQANRDNRQLDRIERGIQLGAAGVVFSVLFLSGIMLYMGGELIAAAALLSLEALGLGIFLVMAFKGRGRSG